MFVIFTGEVNGQTNLILWVNEDFLRMVQDSSGLFWRFDYESGEFVAVEGTGANWAAQIIELSGRNFRSASVYKTDKVTMQMVDYKLSPAV